MSWYSDSDGIIYAECICPVCKGTGTMEIEGAKLFACRYTIYNPVPSVCDDCEDTKEAEQWFIKILNNAKERGQGSMLVHGPNEEDPPYEH